MRGAGTRRVPGAPDAPEAPWSTSTTTASASAAAAGCQPTLGPNSPCPLPRTTVTIGRGSVARYAGIALSRIGT
jgi:hypothetical protein